MDFKEIDFRFEVINSHLELIKSIIEVINLKTEGKTSDIKVNTFKIEVSKFDTYVNKLITEVNIFKTELINLKTAVNTSENSIDIRDKKIRELLRIEMRNEPGGKFYYERIPLFVSAIFLLIAKRNTCNTHDIKTNFKVRSPSYFRYMKLLKKWNWVEYAPGRKRENFMLSKKGNEILQKVLSE